MAACRRMVRHDDRWMADSTTIAVVSVSVAGITALATPPLTAWFDERKESRRFGRERLIRDVTELRALLDDALIAISEAFYRHSKLTVEWGLDPGANHTDLFNDLFNDVLAKRESMVLFKTRLETRLGPGDAVTQAYDEAIDLFDEAFEPIVDAHVAAKMGGGPLSRPSEKDAFIITQRKRDMNA